MKSLGGTISFALNIFELEMWMSLAMRSCRVFLNPVGIQSTVLCGLALALHLARLFDELEGVENRIGLVDLGTSRLPTPAT
tara:strand:+ start:375 stop:617 length:243 start_codon:yes stop_codon:yes gene_type:complete